MPNNRVFYIGHYTNVSNLDERYFSPAARNKMDYIICCLKKTYSEVNVVSASWTVGSKSCGIREVNEGGIYYHYFSSKGKKGRYSYWFDIESINFQLYTYLKKTVKHNDTMIVYHSLYYMPIIRALKKKLGFRLILEFEEFYGDVKNNKTISIKELEYTKVADAYIFPSEMLDKKVNIYNKPSVVIYGTYSVEPERKLMRNDDLIHVVYAGTLDPRKGSLAAAALGNFLPANYRVHILGFGDDKEIEGVKNTIKDNSSAGACVTYDGLLNGEDYIRFLQSCDIGLCTQDLDASFNETSFPSKILSYLSNGLRVVCTDLEAIRNSKVGSLLYFYKDQSSKEIADTILSIDFSSDYDSRKVIKDLDEQFNENLKDILYRYCL